MSARFSPSQGDNGFQNDYSRVNTSTNEKNTSQIFNGEDCGTNVSCSHSDVSSCKGESGSASDESLLPSVSSETFDLSEVKTSQSLEPLRNSGNENVDVAVPDSAEDDDDGLTLMSPSMSSVSSFCSLDVSLGSSSEGDINEDCTTPMNTLFSSLSEWDFCHDDNILMPCCAPSDLLDHTSISRSSLDLDHPTDPSTPIIPVTPSEKEHHDDISSGALPLEMILSPIVPVESPLLQPLKCKVYDSPPNVPKGINNTDRCDVAVGTECIFELSGGQTERTDAAIPSARAEREHGTIEGAQPLENLPTDTNVEVDQINHPEGEVSTVLEYPDKDAPTKPCVSLLRQSFSCGFCEAESTVPIATMCGHVLCQSCVLRQLSNEASLRCPACNVTILLKLDVTDYEAISNARAT